MLQAIVKKGKVLAEEIPAPMISDNSVLIKVVNSCISAGTEMSSVQASEKSLIKKVIENPALIGKFFNMVKANGLEKSISRVQGQNSLGAATGYSISGVVIGVGKNVNSYKLGDKVAAAGAGIANHAEFVDVPENLVMPLPHDMDFKLASTVTLGGIALQGVRRADLKLGEFGVVVGTGILGLLTIQMLKNSGIRVAAIDLDDNRLSVARELGAEITINPLRDNSQNIISSWSGGYGADSVIFTAATSSSEPLSEAFKFCKKKGKVVLVGVVGMEIKREDMYPKELDFLISTSYGPGRYDKNYEEKGLDYPYSYVRWTENRNMQEYLRQVNEGSIKLDKIIEAVYPIENVTEAFEQFNNTEKRPLMVILDYGKFEDDKLNEYLTRDRRVFSNNKSIDKNVINIGLIGAGGFATGMHLPNIVKMTDKYSILAIMDKSGITAKSAALQYSVNYSTTNFDEIINDSNVDLVMICSRHDSHAEYVLKALQAGKHVFVEKPLATNQEELNKIKEFYNNDSTANKPVLMVGFNRRFSKYAQEIKKHTEKRTNPLFINYRMNAGFIPLDHWVHEHNGRIVGEGCHIIDLMTFLTGCKVKSVSFESLTPTNNKFSHSDNKSIVLKYEDGSVCVVNYFAVGSKEVPKEYMEVHFDEKTIIMEDYKSLKGYGLTIEEVSSPISEKGQFEEMLRLYETLKGKNTEWPIAYWDMIQTTELTFQIING